ncbi:MAG TPA: NADH-quinone oxidoreductase subunit N, partial [Casimicrobiaceae bacterium]|nr:NADH-quinone oxidoreductase subunit N [Casimicrobiaceae bacterium]
MQALTLAFDYIPALPEIVLLVFACVVLMIDLFVPEPRRHISYWLTLFGIAATASATLYVFHRTPVRTFGNMFVADAFGDLLTFLTCLTVMAMLVYSRSYLAARGLFRGETFVLAMFALLGMLVMISANHFLTLYLGLELMSLSLYAMVALYRESGAAVEAAMKYFVLGALASGLLLYGISMIYGATGALEINRVTAIIFSGHANGTILIFGLVFVVSAIAFKLGAVPYHMWVPDVYQGAPTAITLFIGTAPELAAFAFMTRILVGSLVAV